MIPAQNIVAWGNVVPWADQRQVEQDLIISRALVEIFSDQMLRGALRIRGGTALNKLHFPAQSDYADKIRRILARLEEASEVGNMDLPGFRLHPLKGDLAGFWSVTVSGNWRVIFRFEAGRASDVDLIDYH